MKGSDSMKEIPDFEGYFISRKGKVYSTLGKGRRDKSKHVKPYELKPRKTKNGYLRVYMRQTSTNKRVDRYIHILVAEAYIPKPDNKNNYEVNHKDFDKTHNEDTNLEWLSRRNNLQYTFNAGRLQRDSETGRYTSGISIT